MATKEETPVQILDRSMRKTRGKRMSNLVDDELETDEQFWGQEAFKEEDNDDEYEQEGDAVDEFDSDFDDDEPVADEEPVEAEERTVKKKKFLLGTVVKKKSKKKVLASLEISPETAEYSAQESKPSHSKDQETAIDLEGEKTVRKSTRTAVIVRQAERDALRAALQASIRPVKRKREGEDRRMTQEEMLLEAAQTEIMNIRHLEKMLAREEEVKKKAITNKSVYSGPVIRFHSKDGKNTLEFTNVSTFPSEIFSKSVPYPEQPVCVVTGQLAKYLDPKTGMPYATKEAFKIIRERFSEINKHLSGDHVFEKGSLATSILGQGFARKGKRSSVGRFRSSATQRKRSESELQSAELFLPSSVDINDASPAVSDLKHDLQTNATRDLSSLPSSSTLLQPAHEFNGHDNGESDPKTCTKEKCTVTPPGGSVPTLSIGSPLSGPEMRQTSMFEDLDLGLRLGTGSKVPKGLIFKDPKP
ncbi:hypothetical protein SUGI_1077400 [Cryptomeria japonica]|uniref:SWR1 complex subunit 2 n=1 Tax=Cryptomeria japonica TaxID=3369 RepID=UPI00241468A4|nr:SWR1 complex subunit 2 [Cryptomeria japonica]XP_057871835.1 SWR1 complex subunit 2 [Cryptomeria japonica]XP_057871836.1 SWR1 complex subunit 2 [Cryptomeria japonica]GLJ50577.1 hypothetical protein SUGI_1077400 [Cryptomeria japonica]